MSPTRLAPPFLALFLIACGSGDNSAAQRFYATVKEGALLTPTIAEAEKAQLPDIEVSVSARGCQGGELFIKRQSFEPSIRITEPPPNPSREWEHPYTEKGYASRTAFVRALEEVVPRFYICKDFRFTFGRYQGWPRSDSFTVTVDGQGRILSVSPLTEDDYD